MNSPMRHVEGSRHAGSNSSVPALEAAEAVALNLCAVVLAVRQHEPVVALLKAPAGKALSLPCGGFIPSEHGSLKDGLCNVLTRETGLRLRNTQRLATFGEGILRPSLDDAAPGAQLPLVSLCYLALVQPDTAQDDERLSWVSWYEVFPWEDFRNGKPSCLSEVIEPALAAWVRSGSDTILSPGALSRSQRVRIAFGADGKGWDEEKVVERYDILCEAGLAGEEANSGMALWHPSMGHHARVLAAAIADVRRSIKSRPDIFDLMPELFTLFELQKAVEGILGPHLHKQNFRRLVEGEGLVEPTEEFRQRTGGRPARLYRFRRSVLLERPAPGVRLKPGRAA